MADIIELSGYLDQPDWESMDREELVRCRDNVRARLELLEEREPQDMESQAYQDWGERHEALEDLADELWDRLDELGGGDD